MDLQAVLKEIEVRKEELFGLLSALVQINSESFQHTGNEKKLAEYVHRLCEKLGLESSMYSPLELEGFTEHPDYMPGRGLEDRYNVTACWKGKADINGLMLMAHLDTVEIGSLSNWEFPPLSGEIRDGKIFGRGACDDKYAIATVLFLVKLLKEAGFQPKENLLFAAYCDEEYGGSHGALAAVLRDKCGRIVSMDGREGQLWHCGSGGAEFKYRFHCAEPVDSARRVARAMPLVLDVIDAFAARRKAELERNRFYAGTIIPGTSLRYMGVKAGNDGVDLGEGEVYFVFYTDKARDEILCEFAEFEELLKEKLEPLGMVSDGFRPATRFFHYVFCEPDSPDVLDMVEAAKAATGEAPLVCGSCLSDLSVISKYGSDRAFGFGMGRDFSKKGGAHQPNEYMDCENLLRYAKTMAAYILKVLQ